MKLILNNKNKKIFVGSNDDITFNQTEDILTINGSKFKVNKDDIFELISLEGDLPSTFINNMFYLYDGQLKESIELKNAKNKLRIKRNQLLSESDWTQLPDVSLENKADWDAYRQSLRDLPSVNINPFNVDWPKDPNWVEDPEFFDI